VDRLRLAIADDSRGAEGKRVVAEDWTKIADHHHRRVFRLRRIGKEHRMRQARTEQQFLKRALADEMGKRSD
jgi:hypothetical protein